jgi:3-isopropylmalate/(R)-2-methylmalate dehydratase small subunit
MISDLAAQHIVGPDGKTYTFDIHVFRKRCPLDGLDELGFTLEHRDVITTFEARQAAAAPWLSGHAAR